MRATLLQGDCVERMRELDADSIDAVVCDPPYGLEFMGKEWDRLAPSDRARMDGERSYRVGERGGAYERAGVKYVVAGREMQDWHEAWAREALRVLKPGGHLLAFGGTRTYHRLAAAVEDAGFEIRDQLAYMYGSGFPKSLDVSKAIDKAAGAEREIVGRYRSPEGTTGESSGNVHVFGEYEGGALSAITAPATEEAARWQGWGTALKPAFEPVVVARKPLGGSIDVQAYLEGRLRRDGVDGEIRWMGRPVSDAGRRSRSTTSGSTGAQATGETSARTVSAGATPTIESVTERRTALADDAGASGTPSTTEPSAGDASASSASRSSRPTALPADAAERTARSSSPSTTSPEGEPPIGERSTGRSTRNSDARDSPRGTESFAGTATGRTGSLDRVPIRRNDDGSFEWPDGVPERIAVSSTVAANVLAHGVGGINVDACRIGTSKDVSASPSQTDSELTYGSYGVGEGRLGSGFDAGVGRWPANVVLGHSPDCVPVGTREVASDGHYPSARPGGVEVGTVGHAGQDGLEERHTRLEERHTRGETVEVWECVGDCPVRLLDEQTGDVGAAAPVRGTEPSAPTNGIYGDFGRLPGTFYGDGGGASRFFYTAKTSRAERNAGLDGFTPQFAPTMGNGIGGKEHDPETATPKLNSHPTVKPIDLMRWLLRLVVPPGGRILDPFLGSGTTGCAAALEGLDFVGVELDPDYLRIAEARIAFWREYGEDGLRVVAERAAGERVRAERAATGQLDLLGETA